MQIYGPSQLHGAQQIGPPHTSRVGQSGRDFHLGSIQDVVDISDAAQSPTHRTRLPASARTGSTRSAPRSPMAPTRRPRSSMQLGAPLRPDGMTEEVEVDGERWTEKILKPSTVHRPPSTFTMSHSFSLGSVYVELPPAERFAQFLQGRGKRLTTQRQIIVQQVFSHHDHFDADELLEHLRDWIQSAEAQPADRLSHPFRVGRGRHAPLHGRSAAAASTSMSTAIPGTTISIARSATA